MTHFKRLILLFGLLGLAGATALIVVTGYDAVMDALARAGWGIIAVSLLHIVPMIVAAVGWRVLLPGKKRPGNAFFLFVLWIRASVNNLMPVARIGGEVVSVRILTRHGVRLSSAIACTVVETTLSVMAVFLFTLMGVGLFMLRVSDDDTTLRLLIAVLVSAPLIAVMLFVQKVGFFGLISRLFTLLFRDRWAHMAGGAARLDRAVRLTYRRRRRALLCGAAQFASWGLGSLEIWAALHVLGHPLSLTDAIMIEALIQAVSSAAFVVPGALGVQEAGFLLLGRWLGLPPDVAAALAVMRRCRDILLYVPGLIAWQMQEGRWLMKSARA